MGKVYLYTGTGIGKTTSSLGLALRSIGHNRTVVIIQFLKWRKDTGEYKIRARLRPHYKIYQFGRQAWLGEQKAKAYFGRSKFAVESFQNVDREMAKKGLEFAGKILRNEKPDLLVLDEINLALRWKLLGIEEVCEVLDNLPKETDVVLTGRYAPKELILKADFVTTVRSIKTPTNFEPAPGINY